MADKPTARVTVSFDVAEKLAPQLEAILRGVPSQFPCTFLEPGTVPVELPSNAGTPVAAKPAKKPGLVKRILGKGK